MIGKQVFADTAFSISDAAEEAGKRLEPSEQESEAVKDPNAHQSQPPTSANLEAEASEISKVVEDGIKKTGRDALSSAAENLSGEQKDTLLYRLKGAVSKLQKREDYSDSVSTISRLIKRYALAYSRAADETISVAQDDINTNPELDRAAKNFWSLLRSFGDSKEWDTLEKKCEKVIEHSRHDPSFEKLMMEVATAVQKMLSDPDFFDSAEEKVKQLRKEAQELGQDSSIRADVDSALNQFQITFKSALSDPDVSNLITTTTKIFNILSPMHTVTNPDLLEDSLHVFIPLLIQTIQYLPILRLEVSTPEIDLLLENLIIEPGRTLNNTSFLPYKLRVETQNDLEVRKTHTRRTVSTVTSLLTIAISGLSMRADEVGFWLRAHSGIFHLADEGIMSFQLDEQGIDIAIDVEIGREKVEKMLTLRKVRVNIHKLSYSLRKSKFSWLAWLIKPILRPILRRVMEKQLATAIADGIRAANRELLFARERLRATRISDPRDLQTFVKAIITRLTPAEDPDVYTAFGVTPSKGVFKGVYAPGSVVKLFEDEARLAQERVEDNQIDDKGWRNEIFDVQTARMEMA